MKINNFFNLKLQNKSSYLYFYRKYNTYYNFNKVTYYLWGNIDKSQIRTIENFITESPNIEKISLEYEKKFINLKKIDFNTKSKALHRKITLKDGLFKLNKKDLKIFKIDYETNNHIIFKHLDNIIGYMVIVSILKFYPNFYGNFIFYKVSYYELKIINNKFQTKEYILVKEVIWAEKINLSEIGNNKNNLELQINAHYLDYKRDLNLPPLNLLLINSSLINNEYKNIINLHYWNIYLDKNEIKNKNLTLYNNENLISIDNCEIKICNALQKAAALINNLNIKNRFIIYNYLVKLESLFLFNLFKDNENITNNFNTNMCNNNQNFLIERFLLKIVKNNIKVYGKLELKIDKDNNIINYNKNKFNEKMSNLNLNENIFDINKINKVPILFFKEHIYNDIFYHIKLDSFYKNNWINNYFNNGLSRPGLLSTFIFIEFKDEKEKNNLILLHLNHKTGHIDDYIEFNNYMSNIKIINNKYIINNSYKFLNYILNVFIKIHTEFFDFYNNKFFNFINYFKDDKNNKIIKKEKETLYYVNISTVILNLNFKKANNKKDFNSINFSKLHKNSKIYFNKIKLLRNIDFLFFDLNNNNNGLLIKDFLYIFRNKHSHKINIDNLIINFNNLVDSRIRKLNKDIKNNDNFLKEV